MPLAKTTKSKWALVLDGLVGALMLLALGLVLRWLGAHTAGALVLACTAAPIGWACAQVVRSRRPCGVSEGPS